MNIHRTDRVRFAICRPYYQWRVATRVRIADEPGLVFFAWRDEGNFLGGHIEILVYDDSGEIMRLPERPSPAWQARAARSPHWLSIEGLPTASAKRLRGHFYLAGGRW